MHMHHMYEEDLLQRSVVSSQCIYPRAEAVHVVRIMTSSVLLCFLRAASDIAAVCMFCTNAGCRCKMFQDSN